MLQMKICTSLKDNLEIVLSVSDPTHEEFLKAGIEQVSSYCIGCSAHLNDAPSQAHHCPIAELESRPAKPTSREICVMLHVTIHGVMRWESSAAPPHTKLFFKVNIYDCLPRPISEHINYSTQIHS